MTVADVIKKFGGYKAMAQTFGVVPTAVLNWRKANRFPPRLALPILKEAKRRRFRVDEQLFEPADQGRAA